MLRERAFMVVCNLLIVFAGAAAAQDQSAKDASPAAIARRIKISPWAQASIQSAPFQLTPLVAPLALNRGALRVPPVAVARYLVDEKAPSTSGKVYPMLELSGANLLMPTKGQHAAFRDFTAWGVDLSKLRGAKLPDLRDSDRR